jgi:hypothetical protein
MSAEAILVPLESETFRSGESPPQSTTISIYEHLFPKYCEYSILCGAFQTIYSPFFGPGAFFARGA